MTDEVTTEESATEDTDTEVVDQAEGGKAEDGSDTEVEKNEGDGQGDDDSGELEYSATDFELPEGVELDEAMMGGFMDIAKEAGISKDAAQKLVSLYAGKQQEAVDAQFQQWDDVRKGWQADFNADKEFGGKNAKENLALANKALAHFGSKELKEFGEHYGWADNPEYLKMLVRVGKTLSEDSAAQGGGNDQTPIEKRWYGTGDK